ncbi:nucleotide exchange factor GrpE [Rhodothermaceae bacterium RA]|nr:nucleotide exchange factor GrpE [Rhodothermaceae bacterium RA]
MMESDVRGPQSGAPDEQASTTVDGDGAEVTVEQLQADLDAVRQQLLRTAADFQNFRRRAAQERESLVAAGRQQMLDLLLDLYDDVTRALESVRQQDDTSVAGASPSSNQESLQRGVELIHHKFAEALRQLGVEPIEAVGKPFDVEEHEAVMQQPAPEGVPAGTVLSEVKKGYRMGDRILRHAKVVVAS